VRLFFPFFLFPPFRQFVKLPLSSVVDAISPRSAITGESLAVEKFIGDTAVRPDSFPPSLPFLRPRSPSSLLPLPLCTNADPSPLCSTTPALSNVERPSPSLPNRRSSRSSARPPPLSCHRTTKVTSRWSSTASEPLYSSLLSSSSSP
jgi:hypothetical protein